MMVYLEAKNASFDGLSDVFTGRNKQLCKSSQVFPLEYENIMNKILIFVKPIYYKFNAPSLISSLCCTKLNTFFK